MYAPDASPKNWTIEATKTGFILVDAFGEEASPNAFTSWKSAEEYRDQAIAEFNADYEPPETGDAWTDGFAENH